MKERSDCDNLPYIFIKLTAGDCHEPIGSRNDTLVYVYNTKLYNSEKYPIKMAQMIVTGFALQKNCLTLCGKNIKPNTNEL